MITSFLVGTQSNFRSVLVSVHIAEESIIIAPGQGVDDATRKILSALPRLLPAAGRQVVFQFITNISDHHQSGKRQNDTCTDLSIIFDTNRYHSTGLHRFLPTVYFLYTIHFPFRINYQYALSFITIY
jgi:hypothetical protein